MPMVLRDCPTGRRVTLRRLTAGRHDRLRLVELGFVPGASIRVIGRGTAGALVVAVGDARVAMDARIGGSLVVEAMP
jgi:ferrous iron transport protein A